MQRLILRQLLKRLRKVLDRQPVSRLIFFKLSLILISSSVWAQSPASKADKYSSYFYQLTPSKELVSKIASSSAGAALAVGSSVARSTVSETQALFLMATLASIEGMKQQVEISGIKKEKVSLEDLATVAKDSAEHLVKSSEIAGGLGGMFLTNKAMKVPLDAWNSLVMSASARPLLKELVANSSANLVGFVGFEAGAELMSRAVQMIPDESDRQKASKLVPTMWSAFTTKDSNQSQDEKRIISAVFSNMYEILVENEELREKWWSFVVRNRIATGNFTVGVSMMAAGATLGGRVGSCIPNPLSKIVSPVIGAAFGVAGGVAASYVPQEKRDDITKGFLSGRAAASSRQIRTSQLNLLSRVENENKFIQSPEELKKSAAWKTNNFDTQVSNELMTMQKSREDLLTAFYDRIHLLNSRLYNLQNKIQLAKESQNPEAERHLQKEYDVYFEEYKKSRSEIDKNLGAEITYFEGLTNRSKGNESKGKIKTQLETVKAMQKWTGRFLDQVQSTASWGQKTISVKQEVLMSEQENQRLLEKFYMWGFKQKPFLETMEFNN